MRFSLLACALAFAAFACSAPPKKKNTLDEGSAVPDQCCCKWNPVASDNGEPKWEMSVRMECSSKHGDCVDDVQCQKAPAPEGPPTPE